MITRRPISRTDEHVRILAEKHKPWPGKGFLGRSTRSRLAVLNGFLFLVPLVGSAARVAEPLPIILSASDR